MKSVAKDLKKETNNNITQTVGSVLEDLAKLKGVPNVYKQLISELRKDSPISSWLPSFIRKDTILLLSFLEEEDDIFSSFEKTLQVTEAFPYLTKVLSEILKHHSCTFLPKNISKLVINMIELREDFNRLAEETAVKRSKTNEKL